MIYSAITFDTQVVFANSFALETGLLAQLKQFKGGPVRVVLADVTVKEIERRLIERAREAHQRLKEARRDAHRFGLIEDPAANEVEFDPEAVSKARIKRFLDETGAEIIRARRVSIDKVLQRYFDQLPPFGTGKKSKEFPDALALMAIEKWAAHAGLRVIAASGDGDWQAFAEGCEVIDAVERLSDAIERVQANETAARAVADAALKIILEEADDGPLTSMINRALKEELEARRFLFDADSTFDNVRQETAEVTHRNFVLEDDWNAPPLPYKIITWSNDTLAIELPLTIRARVDATFVADALPGADIEFWRYFEMQSDILLVFDGDMRGTPTFRTASAALLGADPIRVDLGNIDAAMRSALGDYY